MTIDGASPRHTALGSTRRQNLAAILSLLHHGGPQPRSRLTASTGRNRSTVAALVAELVSRGLAVESDADPTRQVGRPSPTVTADARNVAIAVNPEVDAITIGIVALGGRVLERRRLELEHPPSARDAAALVGRAVEEWRNTLTDRVVHGIGVAVPGLVRATDGLVRWAPHLRWFDEPVSELVAAATGLPVLVGNDASLGAVAERLFGAGRGVADLVYLNGGASGIGGGVIVGGVLVQGASGYAGEFGHLRVDASTGSTETAQTDDAQTDDAQTDDAQTDSDDTGSLESRVARSDLTAALGLGSVDADRLEAALLAATDPAVDRLVHRQLDSLSVTLRNIVDVLNPRMIVLGGFLGSILLADPDYLAERVAAGSIPLSFESVAIRRASLGSDLLMIGAAELVFARLLDELSAGGATTPASGSRPPLTPPTRPSI